LKYNFSDIKGIAIDTFSLTLKKVGDLIHFDGPLMSVYHDVEDSPYIFDWVEGDDKFNRWLIFQTDTSSLKDFISGKITHVSLLNNPVNDLIYMIDKNHKQDICASLVISPKNIPYEYLPDYNIIFNEEDSVNLDNIISHFNLKDSILEKADHKYDILSESIKEKSELINLHINSKSSKVGFGKIRSSILGEVLTNFHKINSATAVNIFDSKSKIPKEDRPRRKKGELKEIMENAEYEFIYAKAASFSVFLRPIRSHLDLFSSETSSEKIINQIFKLFTSSTEIESLKKIKADLNDEMLSAYHALLHEIKIQDISLDISYGNPKKKYKLEESFNPAKANRIVENLDRLEFEDKTELKVNGNFKALDMISNSFKFQDYEDDIYLGKFSNDLLNMIFQYNLKDSYSAVIEIIKIKKSGKNQWKEKITMISCYVSHNS